MNEFHRVSIKTVYVGGKDINLTLEEEYAPQNPAQLLRCKVVGPDGLETRSIEEMLTLLEKTAISERPAIGNQQLAFGQQGNRKTLGVEQGPTCDLNNQRPYTGPSGIIENAFDLMGETSVLSETGTESAEKPAVGIRHSVLSQGEKLASPSPAGDTSPSKKRQSAINMPAAMFVEDNEDNDVGDPTRDYRNGREHSARIRKFEKEHPYLWKDYDAAFEAGNCERNSVMEEMSIVWMAEQARVLTPELYAAALDPKKYVEYMNKNDYWTGERLDIEDLEADEEPIASDAPRCQFIKSDGANCGCPALKGRRLCHFHSKTSDGGKRKRSKSHKTEGRGPDANGDTSVNRELPVLELPVLEDDLAIQMAVTNICRRLANESLEPKRAATLLYGLQVASVAVRRTALNRRECKS